MTHQNLFNQQYTTKGNKDGDGVKPEPSIGIVTKVYEHDDVDDKSNHEVNVKLVTEDEEHREIPVHIDRHGAARVPRKYDPVEVDYLGGNTQRPFVSGFVHTGKNRAPLAREGHWRYRFGDSSPYLFVEAEPKSHSGTDTDQNRNDTNPVDVVRMAKKSDGLSDPTTAVTIDDSGSTTVVSIESEETVDIQAAGDINISAGGNVYIDEGGTTKKVATEDHVHDVTLSDGSTGTTTKPDDVTNVELE